MTLIAFLEIVGMAIVGALGGVGIFEILRRIEKRRATPAASQDSTTPNSGKLVMPTVR